MKNKAFTLIELLAVITILAIIVLITAPLVLNTVEDSAASLSKTQKIAIENAAREWAIKNVSVDNDNKINGKKYTSVTVKKLQEEHYLDNKDSLKKIKISNLNKAGICIKVNLSGNEFVGFTYKYKTNVTGTKCA